MNVAVLLAGGSGKRMGGPEPKQFIEIAGRTILEHSIRAFSQNVGIDEILIVSHADYVDRVKSIAAAYPKVKQVITGGKERYNSTINAMNAIIGDNSTTHVETSGINILIHDSVRPLVSQRIISDCIDALKCHHAVDVAIPCTDTIIEVDETGNISRMPKRSSLRNVQTPQGFAFDTIWEAYERGLKDPDFITTDDCGVVFKYLPDEPIFVVNGDTTNIKITYPEDLILANKILSKF